MILCDVNVLVYAHKEGTPRHPEFRDWLQSVLDGDAAYGVSDLVLSGFVRVVTMPRLWDRPSTPDEALTFASAVRDHRTPCACSPASGTGACSRASSTTVEARGNLIPDAYWPRSPSSPAVMDHHRKSRCVPNPGGSAGTRGPAPYRSTSVNPCAIRTASSSARSSAGASRPRERRRATSGTVCSSVATA